MTPAALRALSASEVAALPTQTQSQDQFVGHNRL